jgi:hypothetical protein
VRPSRSFLVKGAIRTVTRLPRYFAQGNTMRDSLTNLAIAVRRFPETLIYDLTFGHPPDYVNPPTYTEKVQWRKLFDRNPEFVVWCNKLAARDLAKQRAPRIRLPELLWQGTDPEAIPLDELTPPFVIKANNRSGAVIIVEDESDLDEAGIRATCRRWMEATPHRRRVYEWAYGRVPTSLFVEEFLSRQDARSSPWDLKVLVFNGTVRYIYVRDVLNARAACFNPEWVKFDWARWEPLAADGPVPQLDDFPRPKGLDVLIEAAEQIGAGLGHLRVDLYDIDGDIYFGEATVYPSSGHKQWFPYDAPCDPYPPDGVDREMGAHWDLPTILRRTIFRRGLGRFR